MNQDFYISLLYKKFQNLLEPEEQSELENWLSQSIEHQKLANEITETLEKADSYPLPEVEIELETEFDKLWDRIEADDNPKFNPLEKSFPRLRVAAAVLILAVMGYFISKPYLQPAWEEVHFAELNTETVLPDGSKVWLTKGAFLRYPRTFSEKNRGIELQGEAFLEIQEDAHKPFTVSCKLGSIQVLGTSFLVKEEEAIGTLEVLVVSGKVQVKAHNSAERLLLTANQKGIWDQTSQRLTKIDKASLNEVGWHTKALQFEDTPLQSVLEILAQTYQVSIELENKSIEGCPFSLLLETEDVAEYFSILEEVFGFEVVSIGEKAYRLEGGICP